MDRMRRKFSALPVVSLWAMLAATLVGPGLPDVARGADASRQPSVARAVRRVHVHRVWCGPGMESDGEAGMSLYGHVEALGLKWQSLRVEVRLRTLDGQPVRVAPGAPQGYADEKGLFSMSTRAPVFDDHFQWQELRASLPYEKVLDLPADRPHRLIATFGVSCGGLSSSSESEITIPPAPAPGVKRAVRLLAIDLFPDGTPPESASGPAGPQGEAGHGPPKDKRGLTVEGYVEAVGLDRSKIIGRLALRGEDGRPFVSKDPKTGADRPFEHLLASDVISDQAQILVHFAGYAALGLEPGQHRLILSYSARCDGLTAMMEEEHVLPVATFSDP